MGASPGLGQQRERAVRNRALARWLLSAGPDIPPHQRQAVTAELGDQDGLPCVRVMAADGHVLAAYLISTRGGRQSLRNAPGAIAPPAPQLRSATLRKNAAAELSRGRELRRQSLRLRTRSLAALTRSAALIESAAEMSAGSRATVTRARVLQARSAALRSRARVSRSMSEALIRRMASAQKTPVLPATPVPAEQHAMRPPGDVQPAHSLRPAKGDTHGRP